MGFSSCRYNTKEIARALDISETKLVEVMKENSYGGIAKLWCVNDEGKYSTANLSVSKKKPETENEYIQEFNDAFVRFVGHAHEKAKGLNLPTREMFMDKDNPADKHGIAIRIINCDSTTHYNYETQKVYKNYTVFEFDVLDSNKNTTTKSNSAKPNSKAATTSSANEDSDEEELPF